MQHCSELDAYRLMHDGATALAHVEQSGLRIDVDYLKRTESEVEASIKRLRTELQKDDVYKLLVKRFGSKANIGSGPQLAKVLRLDLGYELPTTSASTEENKRYQTDETALAALGVPYISKLSEMKKLDKLRGTYISGVLNEVVDDFLHPFFNLHIPTSFRSSSDSPNFQNLPVRNELISKLIRQAFIPRDGHVLVEVDYAALEFRIAACVWEDPNMIDYASDPSKDIHGDLAREIYKLPKGHKNKNARYCAKNKFVFPELYGDFYIPCAKNCWEAIDQLKLEVDGVPMLEHLRQNGISRLGACDTKQETVPGTFEHHLKKMEKMFFEWFPVLKQKKENLLDEYKRTGQFQLATGFVIKGPWKRNFILNAVVQGPAFHLLLWSLIQTVKWTKRYKTKSLVVGQIHDSMLGDVHRSELQDYLNTVERIMTEDVRKHYPWVVTPLGIEVDVAEDNWYNKKPWIKKDGTWQPKAT